jgi:small conductance mechanosensitive channel
VFGISYEDSIADALQLIEEIVRSHPLVLRIPEPVIKVDELADSAVKLVCRPWAKSGDYWTVHWDLTRQVKERFDRSGISIPYPQREVHMSSEGGFRAQMSSRRGHPTHVRDA